MGVLVTLWLASVFAAICFFVAGLATHSAVARRRSRTGGTEARCVELEHALTRANDSLRGEVVRAGSIADELRTLQLASQSLVPASEVEALRNQLAETQRRVAADAAAQRRALVSAEVRARKIETELEAARARVTAMGSELASARAARPVAP